MTHYCCHSERSAAESKNLLLFCEGNAFAAPKSQRSFDKLRMTALEDWRSPIDDRPAGTLLQKSQVVGVSLKMYFGLRTAHDWCRAVAALVAGRAELRDGRTVLFVAPSHLAIPGASFACRRRTSVIRSPPG